MVLNLRRSRRHRRAQGGSYRPTQEGLEGRDCPSIAVTNLAMSPATINEGSSSTLTGTIVGPSVGDVDLPINWGDGSAVQHLSLAAASQSFSSCASGRVRKKSEEAW
jgi:hypothetical protein